VRISAARGEAEAAQLVIRPQAELDDLTVQATALAGPQQAVIPASAVELLQVGYVSIERPSDPTGAVAGWPDPLLPLAEPLRVPGGANQPIWVRVRVPHDAPAGTYHGELLVQAAGRQVRVPLQVVAFDFDLPARMSCSTAFGFSWPLVVRYQRLRNEADQRAVLDKYLASFAAHHISPYDPAPMDPLRVAWEGLAPRFDWAAWDGAVRRGLDTLGFNSFELPVSGLGGGTFHSRREPELNGHPEGSPEYEAMLAAYLGSLEQHLRERGWLDAAYVYWFDEPEPRDYAFVMNGFRKLRTHAPGIRRMLTEQVEPELIGGPTIWCPVTSSFEPGPAAARQQAGETIWWYVCTGPKAPYAGLFIDHPGTELRVWLWQTWQHQVQGILVWQTNYWTSSAAYPDSLQDPYADPMSWVSGYDSRPGARIPWGNGDGRFVYPPLAAIRGAGAGPVLDGPVESIRWEMLRDGIEDYEYFAMLRALLQRRADLPAGLRASYERLLEVPAAVSASMTEFTRDPGTIEAHRQALAQAIEALSR